jgi:hypothetical protein
MIDCFILRSLSEKSLSVALMLSLINQEALVKEFNLNVIAYLNTMPILTKSVCFVIFTKEKMLILYHHHINIFKLYACK